MHRINRRKRLVALVAVAALAITGAAIAFWTGSGSGSGEAQVGTSGTVTVTGTIQQGIAPGTNRDVSFTAANATDSPIQVTTVRLVSVQADAEHSACTTDDFTMENVTESHEVPANATAEALPNTGTLVFHNTAENQDACKGATLTLTLASS